MELIIFIIMIVIVKSLTGKNDQQRKKTYTNVKVKNSDQIIRQVGASAGKILSEFDQMTNSSKTAVELKEEIWNRLSEETKNKYLQKKNGSSNTSSPVSNPVNFMEEEEISEHIEQIEKRRTEHDTTSILERAMDNVAEDFEEDKPNTSVTCHSQKKNVVQPQEQGNILESISDLMVKGYDARLSFERDFIAEGMDMMNRFTI